MLRCVIIIDPTVGLRPRILGLIVVEIVVDQIGTLKLSVLVLTFIKVGLAR